MKITSCRFEIAAFRPQDEPQSVEPELVFLGRSNVGKSSLINAMLGTRKLARTSSTPGRTQSVNFYRVNDSFRFVDLPGYGYAKVPEAVRQSWGPMIEGALERRRDRIVLAIHVVDARHEPTRLDQVMQEWLRAKEIPNIVTATKADKLSGNARVRVERDLAERFASGPLMPPLLVSSRTAMGIRRLWTVVERALSPQKS
ncbi:MAG: YihA family ribosome biogenesis GTP-binding protein [Acidobacteria bacterium]|nr:YihA family ribosome biogenesis GTP-binding protein [Acidobacteriota bacterium]NIM60473.1 YihA family ribosome biogenesis GTP-binding protein [Acidobacteriota bacterium]NIO60370.1 YihA family ribosome biogenesis GTP-binding protein [Acidobacteriota bacterium]NIQ31442.1 YihA family ribosome biogenesis GTP-binding protein [Acidobacteriota bacterium]NIQ86686.1 YihA family ribosome biogenesis GTP-binding protein [Acidobacteriota bacterium]